MQFVENLPLWLLALGIFSLRIVDVSLGTVRTIAVVQGWVKLSVVLGFFEVLIWIAAISQVIAQINEHPILMVAFACGFATGNAAGILLERGIALGSCVMRIVSTNKGSAIADAFREMGQQVTTFVGEGRDGPRTLLYTLCGRRRLNKLLGEARQIDPDLFYVVERASESNRVHPLPHATVWRSLFKIK